jgi:hypothetical protein
MENPRLIEPGIYYHLHNTLHKCHDYRIQMYTTIFNVGIVFLFLTITGATLYFCYKRRLNPHQKYQKMVHDQETILAKIRYYQNGRIGSQQSNESNVSSITELPIVNPVEYLRL